MTELENDIGYKEIENGYPVYFTCKGLYSEDHRIIRVDDLIRMNGIKFDIILSSWEAKIYKFFEDNNKKAFTTNAFIDKCFKETGGKRSSSSSDPNKVEATLNKMVSEGILKGAYVNGYYYYFLLEEK